jgi:hypothetical protein
MLCVQSTGLWRRCARRVRRRTPGAAVRALLRQGQCQTCAWCCVSGDAMGSAEPAGAAWLLLWRRRGSVLPNNDARTVSGDEHARPAGRRGSGLARHSRSNRLPARRRHNAPPSPFAGTAVRQCRYTAICSSTMHTLSADSSLAQRSGCAPTEAMWRDAACPGRSRLTAERALHVRLHSSRPQPRTAGVGARHKRHTPLSRRQGRAACRRRSGEGGQRALTALVLPERLLLRCMHALMTARRPQSRWCRVHAGAALCSAVLPPAAAQAWQQPQPLHPAQRTAMPRTAHCSSLATAAVPRCRVLLAPLHPALMLPSCLHPALPRCAAAPAAHMPARTVHSLHRSTDAKAS